MSLGNDARWARGILKAHAAAWISGLHCGFSATRARRLSEFHGPFGTLAGKPLWLIKPDKPAFKTHGPAGGCAGNTLM